MSDQIDQLIARARLFLSAPPSNDDPALEALEEYVRTFARWFEVFALLPEDRRKEFVSKVEELNILHEQVLDRATKLKEETVASRREIAKLGKGVLAYYDLLPRRISRSKIGKI